MLSFKNKIIEAHYEKHFSTANIGSILAYSVLSQELVASVLIYIEFIFDCCIRQPWEELWRNRQSQQDFASFVTMLVGMCTGF